MKITIIGGGIVGMALALQCHRRNIECDVFEAAPEIRELGVGITLLPHATRELALLGVGNKIEALGIENRESRFYNRFGQLIYSEPRGRFAGYDSPERGVHRGQLHMCLYEAAREALGDRIHTGMKCVAVDQTADQAIAHFADPDSGEPRGTAEADLLIACDGVNSTVRRHFYPDDEIVFTGINTWRGTTRRKPILDGQTYLRVGSIRTGKMVIYPIIDDIDGSGDQLINWMAEIETENVSRNDWNQKGNIEDFLPIYKDWTFDWLNVRELIETADQILEYPMVDKDPVKQWTFGRITFAGDAAHPMYPRGSNGSAQGLIDARVLADLLTNRSPVEALKAYEDERLEKTGKVVETNRSHPPDFINIRVEELTGDQPFENLDDYISQAELKEMSDRYKAIAGFSLKT